MQQGSVRRYAVFGVNGYLGSHCAHVLCQQGHLVKGYDVQPECSVQSLSYESLDVTQPEAWGKFDSRVDCIFFFSGLTGTYQGFEQAQRFLHANEGGLLFLLETLRKSGATAKVVFPSTRLVYQGSEALLTEDAPKETKTVYAVNKMACEGYLRAYQNSFDLNYTVFRICLPYGSLFEKATSYGTVGFFMRTAQSGRAITLYGDGSQRRTVTHVLDICQQVICAGHLAGTNGCVFNIGGEHYSVRDIAGLIARKYGVGVEYRDFPDADRRLESGTTLFDDTRLRRASGYVRQHSFEAWLEQVRDERDSVG